MYILNFFLRFRFCGQIVSYLPKHFETEILQVSSVSKGRLNFSQFNGSYRKKYTNKVFGLATCALSCSLNYLYHEKIKL